MKRQVYFMGVAVLLFLALAVEFAGGIVADRLVVSAATPSLHGRRKSFFSAEV
jgi:hypothetical protein